MEPVMISDSIVQYGCFGLVAALVVWSLWTGIPGALRIHKETMVAVADEHKKAVESIVEQFTAESLECRKERQSMREEMRQDRESDRKFRHDLTNKFNESLAACLTIAREDIQRERTASKAK